tara:strand:- start:1722 stop:2411 length:690 start_codon:yes stop_codon:yes gene_type:complete
MTNKPFGAEELNIVGDSGTPQIQSADDLFLRVTGDKTVIIGSENADFASPAPGEAVSTNVARLNVGIVTANKYYGDGQYLDNLPSATTINNNADNRVITGSDTANTLNGEANLTFNGTVLTSPELITSFTDVTKTDNYTIVSSDKSKLLIMTIDSKTFTINSSTGFAAGDTVVLLNSTYYPISLVQAGSANLFLSGTTSAGTRTLGGNSVATVLCMSSNNYVVMGQGVS